MILPSFKPISLVWPYLSMVAVAVTRRFSPPGMLTCAQIASVGLGALVSRPELSAAVGG